jgi:reductive dehalogenase
VKKLNRRQFIKASGLASAFLGSAGLGFYGYESGKDPNTYTGCESFQGAAQTFNRKRFAIDGSAHEKVGPTRRADGRTVIFSRLGALFRNWDDEKGIESLPPVLQQYYKEHPEDLELDLYLRKEIMPKFMADRMKYRKQFILAEAWSNAMGAVTPEPIKDPPEVSDFPKPRRMGPFGGGQTEPLKMKDPRETSRLIKQIAFQLGSTLVGITKLNPDWVYSHAIRGRGFDQDKPLEIPKHWEYAIVVGTPMSWDPMYANPNYGTSGDAYSKTRIVAFRLASFIKQLGYPARPHTPGFSYDLMVPPIAIDAGLGEQGRHGVLITPELGSNIRPAVVTTNLPMEPDKPIKFGAGDFCKTCKVCAEQCPSGAITRGGKQEVRGYLRYKVNVSKCHNFWRSNLGNMGCRLCVAVCPYSRKSNWLHRTALDVSANDPTGLSHKILTFFQKIFYPGPDAQKYYMPAMGGENASYREPPWWLKTEDFIDI